MKRVTLKEVAELAKVSAMTVSYALRDDPRICRSTRARVWAAAKKLEYRPDPALSALAMHRQQSRSTRNTGYSTLVYLNNWPERNEWTNYPTYQQYYEGARLQAEQLGYHLEQFWLKEKGMTAARASKILYSRGIKGLIAGPTPQARSHYRLEWGQFCAVAVGLSLVAPALPSVSHNHFNGMCMVVHHLRRLGYRRMGIVLQADQDARVGHAWLAGLSKERDLPTWAGEWVPPFLEPKVTFDTFSAWFRRHKPDVLIAINMDILWEFCRDLGLRAPEDIGFVCLDLGSSPKAMEAQVTGVDQLSVRIGMLTVDQLHSSLLHNQIGISETKSINMLNGIWRPGSTVRPQERSSGSQSRIRRFGNKGK